MKIEAIYELFKQYPEVTTDTRKCFPNSIFFALKGEHFDGNHFVEQALKNGCAYAIADSENLPENPQIIQVENTLQTLQQLANYHRKQFDIPVIGITGTNGKTTTKELTAAVLSSHYRILYTQGNLNNHIGVPLTLLQLNRQHQAAIIEMGANHPGEIRELAQIVEPTHGLITNVGKAHLEGFGSFENVMKTKGELYDFLIEFGGCIFVNSGNQNLMQMIENRCNNKPSEINCITYKVSNQACSNPIGKEIVRGKQIHSETPFLQLEWSFQHESYPILTHLIGKYNLENILAAIAVGLNMKISEENICQAIAAYIPQNNRSQLQQTKNNQLIIDAYNANPTSMLAALENFSEMNVAPKALILGDMKELGENSLAEHQKILDFIEKNPMNRVMLCGEIFSSIQSPFSNFQYTDALITQLKSEPLKGYTILIKGSRGIQLEKVIEFL